MLQKKLLPKIKNGNVMTVLQKTKRGKKKEKRKHLMNKNLPKFNCVTKTKEFILAMFVASVHLRYHVLMEYLPHNYFMYINVLFYKCIVLTQDQSYNL